MPIMQTRRRFLAMMTLAGATDFLSPRGTRAAERPLETTSVRIAKIGAICLAPQYVSEEFLRAEGFTDIRYVDKETSQGKSRLLDPAAMGQEIGRGVADFSTAFAVDPITAIDAGSPIVVLAGVHIGC